MKVLYVENSTAQVIIVFVFSKAVPVKSKTASKVFGTERRDLSLILRGSHCAEEAIKYCTEIIADGGIPCSGNITKADCPGCRSHDRLCVCPTQESSGETEICQGRSLDIYRSMGSTGAVKGTPPLS